MLFSTYPYIFYALLGLPEGKIMNIVFFVLGFVLFLVTKGPSAPKLVTVSFSIQAVMWCVFCVYHNDITYLTRVFFLMFTLVVIQLLCQNKSIYRFGYSYNGIMTLQAVMGAVAFILVFAGLLTPISYFIKGNRVLAFYGLTCTNIYYDNFIRVGGFLDEPGALASWGVFSLVINKLVFNNKKIELSLLISLLFTFSAAYFVLLPLYLLFFYHKSKKSLIWGLMIIIPIMIGGYSLLKDNVYFKYITVDRFEGGEIRSMRYEYADNAQIIFEQNMVMGAGAKQLTEKFEGVNDNQYEILAKDGIVGYFITYLPLLLLCIYFKKEKDVILGSLLLFICYQQRPFHINEMQYFMLYFYISIVYYKYKKVPYEESMRLQLS